MAFERINTIVERMMDRLVDIDGVPNGPGMRLVPASSRQCPRAITAGKLPQLCPPMPHQWNRLAGTGPKHQSASHCPRRSLVSGVPVPGGIPPEPGRELGSTALAAFMLRAPQTRETVDHARVEPAGLRIGADDSRGGVATVVRLRSPGNGRANRARNLN